MLCNLNIGGVDCQPDEQNAPVVHVLRNATGQNMLHCPACHCNGTLEYFNCLGHQYEQISDGRIIADSSRIYRCSCSCNPHPHCYIKITGMHKCGVTKLFTHIT